MVQFSKRSKIMACPIEMVKGEEVQVVYDEAAAQRLMEEGWQKAPSGLPDIEAEAAAQAAAEMEATGGTEEVVVATVVEETAPAPTGSPLGAASAVPRQAPAAPAA
jgi:hypothetical protein